MNIILDLILFLLNIYSWLLIGYILMSWIPNLRDTSFGQFLGMVVEPYLAPFRKIIPPIGMIDISPIVAIIALDFAQRGLVALFNMI
jgi:YggT family protein